MRDETHCCHIGSSFRLAARVLLYASCHRQDNTYHRVCYTSCGALAGMRNCPMVPPWRIDLTTHHTMSERSYHRATSRSQNISSNLVSINQTEHLRGKNNFNLSFSFHFPFYFWTWVVRNGFPWCPAPPFWSPLSRNGIIEKATEILNDTYQMINWTHGTHHCRRKYHTRLPTSIYHFLKNMQIWQEYFWQGEIISFCWPMWETWGIKESWGIDFTMTARCAAITNRDCSQYHCDQTKATSWNHSDLLQKVFQHSHKWSEWAWMYVVEDDPMFVHLVNHCSCGYQFILPCQLSLTEFCIFYLTLIHMVDKLLKHTHRSRMDKSGFKWDNLSTSIQQVSQ